MLPNDFVPLKFVFSEVEIKRSYLTVISKVIEPFLFDQQLSLMVKMIPSPDWFVGLDSVNLCEGNEWKQEVNIDLQPYDAGTDSGFTFSSPNFPTSPPENITMV